MIGFVTQDYLTMPWEYRGAHAYFYRSRRAEGGKIVREYLGRGQAAEAAAREIEQRRARADEDRKAELALRQSFLVDDSLAESLDATASLALTAKLQAEGFHRPNYTVWRRKRRHD
jgi:hypothetical protein